MRIEPPPSLACATGTAPLWPRHRQTPPLRAAGGALGVPRVAGRAEAARFGHGQNPELRRLGLAHEHESRLAEATAPGRSRSPGVNSPSRSDPCAMRRPATGAKRSLIAQGHSGEGAGVTGTPRRRRRRGRCRRRSASSGSARSLTASMRASDASVSSRDGHLAVANHLGELFGRLFEQFLGHRRNLSGRPAKRHRAPVGRGCRLGRPARRGWVGQVRKVAKPPCASKGVASEGGPSAHHSPDPPRLRGCGGLSACAQCHWPRPGRSWPRAGERGWVGVVPKDVVVLARRAELRASCG